MANPLHLLCIAFLVLCASATGLLSINSAFVADDLTLVQAGRHMAEEEPLRPFQHPWVWKEIAEGWPVTSFHYYRPVTIASFAFDSMLWGYQPLGYHITNQVLHIVVTVLVFWLALKCFARFTTLAPLLPAFLSALLFALHPGHQPAVLWISARSDILCAIFYIVTLLLLLRWLDTPRSWHAAAIFLASVAALASKEMAYSLPLVCGLLYILHAPFAPKTFAWWKGAIKFATPAFAAACVMFALRVAFVTRHNAIIDFATSPQQKAYALYQSLRHLVLPYFIPMREWVTAHPIATGLILLCAVWLCLTAIPRLNSKLLLLAGGWVFLTLLPVTNQFRAWYLYIPAIGFAMGLAWLFMQPRLRIVSTAAVAALLFSYGWQGVQTSRAWQEATASAETVVDTYLEHAEIDEPAVFLCVPSEIGPVPLHMHNLPARLRIETGQEALAAHVTAYATLPPGTKSHEIEVEAAGAGEWIVRTKSPEACFTFPEYPQHTTKRTWGKWEVLEENEAGNAVALKVVLAPELRDLKQLYYYSGGRLYTLTNKGEAYLASSDGS